MWRASGKRRPHMPVLPVHASSLCRRAIMPPPLSSARVYTCHVARTAHTKQRDCERRAPLETRRHRDSARAKKDQRQQQREMCVSKQNTTRHPAPRMGRCKGRQAQKATKRTRLSGIMAEPQLSSLALTPPPDHTQDERREEVGAKGHVVSNLKTRMRCPPHGKARRA